MCVTFGPIARSTGSARSNAGLVAADHHRGVALRKRHRAAGDRRIEHREAACGEFAPRSRGWRRERSCSCRCRCRRASARRARRRHRARRRAPRRRRSRSRTRCRIARRPRAAYPRSACRPAISGSALSRARFQPVTAWPAAISRGTISAPIAPRPTETKVHVSSPCGGLEPGRPLYWLRCRRGAVTGASLTWSINEGPAIAGNYELACIRRNASSA